MTMLTMNPQFSFETTFQSKKTNARLGKIRTPHGVIETPAFVPVGTQASVKSLTPGEIKEVGTQLFFVNTYHMAMRPGIDVISEMGGLHSFMRWNGPIITDSGGFQVFSLARDNERVAKKFEDDGPSHVTINDDGVVFRSHWDGAYHTFTPKTSMEYQWKLGSDIHIAFDDCTPFPVTHDEAKKSLERTHRWATLSLDAHRQLTTDNPQPYQALYGSIQGSVFEDLRVESAKFISQLPFDGIAIGGVSVGESKEEMRQVLSWVPPLLPINKPRHLLGVGEIDDIFALIAAGIDTFDCVQPTRLARAGYLFSHDQEWKNSGWEMDINKAQFEKDKKPIDQTCSCYTCTTFSRAYLHHLFKVRELLAYRLATIHNIFFIHTLVSRIKEAIRIDQLLEMQQEWI